MVLLLVGVAAFQVWAASYYTVFDDEAFSCLRYTLPMGEMVSALWQGAEPDPPLYYILQNLWVRGFGVGPLGLRGLSIVFFLIGLIFMHEAARAGFDRQTAGWTLLVCALHPAHLFFGFAGRWYAAMFCAVAMLLYVTARIERAPREGHVPGRWLVAWSAAAAIVCYVNYFGTVVVGLVWLVTQLRHRDRRGWLWAGLGAAALFAPWLPAFWHQATAFPKLGGDPGEMLSTAGRTLMALAAGNLASIAAWWIWAPMAVTAALLVMMLARHWRQTWPLVAMALGCFAAGVVTRVMIDKYILTFSGIACLAAVHVVMESHRKGGRMLPRAAGIALGLAWIGCGVNLVTQSNWSSLRWLDPFERVIEESLASDATPPMNDWVMTHPAGRYYAARALTRRDHDGWRVDPATWRRFALPEAEESSGAAGPSTPARMLARLKSDSPQRILTLHASGFAEDAEWARLDQELAANYELASERDYLEDAEAELKNRIDPHYEHPRWRITVRTWQRKQ